MGQGREGGQEPHGGEGGRGPGVPGGVQVGGRGGEPVGAGEERGLGTVGRGETWDRDEWRRHREVGEVAGAGAGGRGQGDGGGYEGGGGRVEQQVQPIGALLFLHVHYSSKIISVSKKSTIKHYNFITTTLAKMSS